MTCDRGCSAQFHLTFKKCSDSNENVKCLITFAEYHFQYCKRDYLHVRENLHLSLKLGKIPPHLHMGSALVW